MHAEDNIEVIDLTGDAPDNWYKSTETEPATDSSEGTYNKKTEPCKTKAGDFGAGDRDNWVFDVGQEHLVKLIEKMNQEWEDLFFEGAVFDSTSTLREAATSFAARYNMVIVTASHKPNVKILLTCKHGGGYRSHRKKKTEMTTTENNDDGEAKAVRNRKSMKSNCPCMIKARYDLEIKKAVILKSVSGHNHPLAEDARTYALNRRLDVGNFNLARTMLKTNKPAVVLKVITISNGIIDSKSL